MGEVQPPVEPVLTRDFMYDNDTMQTWMVNTQLKMPGHRDRVAHVYSTRKRGLT
jgi:hypothetical protein